MRDSVIAGLDTESATVASATGGDAVKIATTGDNDGELDGHFDPVFNALSYEVQTCSNPNDPASWVYRLTITRTTFTLTGLPSGQRCWVRARAIGAMGPGPWSDPATKMVP